MTRHRIGCTAHRALRASVGLALAAWLSGCIDTPVSLGHHDVPAPGDGDGDGDTNEMDAAMEPPAGAGGTSSGGAGGASGGGAGGTSGADAGGSGGQAQPPSLCDTGTLSAMLECQVDEPFGGMRPRMMSTTTTFSVVRTGRDWANLTGVLDVEAWGLSFDARIEGALDCARGELHANIVDGVATPSAGGGSIRFIGSLDAIMIAPSDQTVRGMWWHAPDMGGGPPCLGAWTATRD